jgi:hypothetical protein
MHIQVVGGVGLAAISLELDGCGLREADATERIQS